jgi:hypothetical protein
MFRRMLLWLFLWIMIVSRSSSGTAEIILNATSVNNEKKFQMITPFQSDPVSINEPAVWTIPMIENENCAIKKWDDISTHKDLNKLKGTIVSFDKRSIWDADCKSYYQVSTAVFIFLQQPFSVSFVFYKLTRSSMQYLINRKR